MRLPLQAPTARTPAKTLIAAPKGVHPLDCSDSCAGLSGMAYELCVQVCQQNQ
jgi:hypothetical protein